MDNIIKTVSDRSQFELLFNNFFVGREIFLKTSTGNLKVQFLGYSDEHAGFRVPSVKNLPEKVTVYTRHKTNTIYASLKLFDVKEDTFIFIPEKFQIIAEARKEDRKLVGAEGGQKNVLYIRNIISDTVIKNAIQMNAKKMEKIIEIATFDLQKQFGNIKIYFITQSKNDIRIKFMQEKKDSIFIQDLNSQPEEEDADHYNYYINNIYSKDSSLSRGHKYISEATAPILHKNVILYGYVQVNNTTAMTDGLLEVVKRMAIIMDQLCLKHNVFAPIQTKFLVSDISKSGLGIVFKERKLISYFRKDSLISFESMLPTQKRAVMAAVVRNITILEGGIIKVGLEVTDMDETSQAHVMEYLQSMGIE